MGNKSSKKRKGHVATSKGLPSDKIIIPPIDTPADAQVNTSSSITDWFASLRKMLHDQYRKLTIRGLPWMQDESITLDDYDIELSVLKQDSHGKVIEEESTELNDLFTTVQEKNKHPFKILVEGPQGHGKSTLASKLCFDHATQKSYIKDFDFVLYYPVRFFRGNLEEMFVNTLDGTKGNENNLLLSILKKRSKKVLLVLDGLDEVPKEFMKPLISLLRGEQFPDLSIVVTSKPGEFTSNTWKWRTEKFGLQRDTGIDLSNIWQKRIKVKGIGSKTQEKFTEQSLVGFPDSTKKHVMIQLQRMKKKGMLSKEILECPLFLLMIILSLTEKQATNLQNIRTRTDLYKLVTNFLFRKYFRKNNKSDSLATFDLFSNNQVCKIQEYADLFSQFGEISLEAVKSGKFVLTKNEILGSGNERNARILELGLLTQNSVQGETSYEPVHKSLMEFAAAYRLCIQFTECEQSMWMKEIQSLVLNPRFGSSKILQFLAGLMGESAGGLFKALGLYASDYASNWEGWLKEIVPELLLTTQVLSSIGMFLPTEWTKKWNDIILKSSPYRDAILRHAIKTDRIKWITWRIGDSLTFPTDVAVKKATLLATSRSSRNFITFRCKHLVCVFSDCIFLPEFQNILSVLPSISYECISFSLGKRLDVIPLPTIRRAITTGKLKDARIFVVKCYLENEPQQLKTLNELIATDRIDALNANIKSNPEDGTGSELSIAREDNSSQEQQEQIDSLIKSAANSSQLTSILLANDSKAPLTIDLSLLCSGKKKAWECLFFKGFKVKCNQEITHTCKAKYMHVGDDEVTYALFNFLRFCQLNSLCCSMTFLDQVGHLQFAQDNLTELNITIDETIFEKKLISLSVQFKNLRILILSMMQFKSNAKCLPYGNPLFTFGIPPRLKGIEIWQIKRNRELALQLVQLILQLLNNRGDMKHTGLVHPFSSVSVSKKFHLEYFLLQNGRGYFDFKADILAQLKETLKSQTLSRLDIVDEFASFSSVTKLFPSEDHFSVEEDLWGARQDDFIQSRVECDLLSTKRLQKRCSIQFAPE